MKPNSRYDTYIDKATFKNQYNVVIDFFQKPVLFSATNASVKVSGSKTYSVHLSTFKCKRPTSKSLKIASPYFAFTILEQTHHRRLIWMSAQKKTGMNYKPLIWTPLKALKISLIMNGLRENRLWFPINERY